MSTSSLTEAEGGGVVYFEAETGKEDDHENTILVKENENGKS